MSKTNKLYRNTGTNASPTWVEMKEMRDLSIPFNADKFEDSDRGSKFKKYGAGMIDLGVTGTMTFRAGNANCQHVRDSILGATSAEYAVMTGDITVAGSEGWRFFGKVFVGNKEEPLSDGDTVDVEFAPTHHEEASAVVEPSYYVVS